MAGAGVFSMDDLLENDMNVAAESISDDDCIEVVYSPNVFFLYYFFISGNVEVVDENPFVPLTVNKECPFS